MPDRSQTETIPSKKSRYKSKPAWRRGVINGAAAAFAAVVFIPAMHENTSVETVSTDGSNHVKAPEPARSSAFTSGPVPALVGEPMPSWQAGTTGSENPVRTLVKPTVTILSGIFFESNEVALPENSEAAIVKAVEVIRDGKCQKITILGHTDSRGRDTYNDRISEDRARSVAEAITALGIPSASITYEGYGSKQPLAGVAPDDDRQRRVEMRCEP